jgi:DNA-directed RNA polymerase subunit RPC12/RpoP
MIITVKNDTIAITLERYETAAYSSVSRSVGRIAAALAVSNRRQCPSCGHNVILSIIYPIPVSKSFQEKYNHKTASLKCRTIYCEYCNTRLIRIVAMQSGEVTQYFSTHNTWCRV